MRTATTRTTLNEDGSFTTELATAPLHYADENGDWQPIDSTLVEDSDGYAWRNRGNDFGIRFKDRLAEDFVQFEVAGEAFTLSLQRANNDSQRVTSSPAAPATPELSPPGAEATPPPDLDSDQPRSAAPATPGPGSFSTSPAPTDSPTPEVEPTATPVASSSPPPAKSPQGVESSVSPDLQAQALLADQSEGGNELTYKEVFPEVDLQYEVLSDGLKETLVLADADAPTRYRFLLDPLGDAEVEATPTGNGGWLVGMEPYDEPVFFLPAPLVFESSPEFEAIADAEVATLDVRETGEGLVLDLAIDSSWLRDPARQFPVYLDPTIVIQPTTADASFKANCPTCDARLYERLYVGTSDVDVFRSALKFDLAAIPAGVEPTAATLSLYYDQWCINAATSCRATAHQMDLHRMSGPWSEVSKTSDVQFDASILASATLAADPNRERQWVSWTVTNLVQSWVAGTQPNYGMLLKRNTEPLTISGPAMPGRRLMDDPGVQPKLEVTYVSDAVTVLPIDTRHSNGADVQWSAWSPPSGAPFERYEVHRGTTGAFTPTSATLLATITDPAVTSYRDTTARPGGTFTYRVVANSSLSNPRTVTLPADGLAEKILQPDPSTGVSTYIRYSSESHNCATYGAEERMYVGSRSTAMRRGLIRFDLRDIPVGATINTATLSLWYPYGAEVATNVELHQVTRTWEEGTGGSSCTADGATWYETDGGMPWSAEGGDFDAEVLASAAVAADADPAWSHFQIPGAIRGWVNGTAPNHGLLLKLTDESMVEGNYFGYHTDDQATAPSQRPKLVITYADDSHADAPHVAVSSPGAGSQVGGDAVSVTVDASDDRRVDGVEFLVDSVVTASDNTAPYAFTWNSTAVANGSHTLSARATDDAGNVATSPGVAVTVDNSSAPTTSITAPANNATVSGTAVTVSASATDDVGVTRVEFYVDEILIGEDATAPYSMSWNTLNADLRFYDGVHVVTSRAYDAAGKVTTSAARNITVANRTGIYKATFALAGGAVLPSTMSYDPGAAQQTNAGTNLTITNNSTSSWGASSIFLRYRWFGPNHTAQTQDVIVGPNVPLGQNVAAGQSVTLNNVTIRPPALPDGIDRGQYRLVLDLFNTSGSVYFADKGNAPVRNQVTVNKVLRTRMGLERFHRYWGTDVGAGMGSLVNVANGNNLLRWTPFQSPGRGLSTVVDLTYNSLEDRSDSPAGDNWSLSISGLTRLGARLDVHPNKSDDIGGNAARWIAFIDGDGTTHRFNGRTVGSTTVWDPPVGVHLYLREFSTTDPARKWAVTRPDRVTFFFNIDGYPTSVVDKNGNELRFTLETISRGDDGDDGDDDGGHPRQRVTRVTDAAGVADGAPSRTFDITYYTKQQAKKAHVRGLIRTITDHTGSELLFEYYHDGNLRRLVQRGGTNADGTALADRVLVFNYTTPSGSGPAIPLAANRVDPDLKTNQSSRVYSVRDANGVETTFSYFGPTSGQLKWKLSGITDRAGQTTAFAYDLAQRVTTVTAPLSRVTRYAYDTDGKVTSITDPLNNVSNVTWTSEFHVASVDEPGDGLTEFAYNDNGYLTDRKVKIGVDGSGATIWSHTRLAYENVAVDAKDVSANWMAGRGIPHISQLASRTDPNGMQTTTPTDDYQWLFAYDVEGNLTTTTDPAGFATTYAYYANGNLQTATDANARITTFGSYDPSGQPTNITDAAGGITQFGYDADGLLRWIQDANHASFTGGDPRTYRSYLDYDSFHRLGRQSTPKSTALESGNLIWSAAFFDPNDNIVREVGPHFGAGYSGAGAVTQHAFDSLDRETLTTSPDTSADPAGERVAMAYDAAGRVSSLTLPKGVATTGSANDFATFYTYDALDRVVRQTRHLTDGAGAITSSLHTHACYDLAGDLTQLTSPRANVSTVNCAAPVEAHSSTFEYDDAHRRTSGTDALAHATATAYDRNGNVTSTTDAAGSSTSVIYDERNMPTRMEQPFTSGTGGRSITTLIEYDPVGNRSRLISPRAFDVANGGPTFTHYVTRYAYDALNRLSRVDLPTDAAYPTQYYVHNAYDAVGNLLWNSMPVTTATAAQVPAGSKTQNGYWDPGWIASTDAPDVTPRVLFDYTAEGLQASRAPVAPTGGANLAEQQLWTYFADGMLRERKDRGGQLTSYTYEAHNNLLTALDASGLTVDDRSPLDIQATWDSLDRLTKVRSREEDSANYRFTTYAYDLNGNITRRDDDGEETPAGTLVSAARRNDYSYDAADWLTTQLDYGTSAAATDDQRITNTFAATGLEQSRDVARNDGSGTWVTSQTTDWTHYLNGQLKTLVTKNGAGATLESHTVEYIDASGDYVNGHRMRDTFSQQGPDTAAPCRTASCTASYTYDAQDRLRREVNGHGATTDYTLDAAGNITRELVTGDGAKDVTYAYTGSQLTSVTAGGATQRHWYDPNGNLDCVTLPTGSQANCAPAAGGSYSPQVLADYSYDYLDRMTQFRSFSTNGSSATKDDVSDYEYDALDRVVEQIESHGAAGSPRATLMTYVGLGTQVSHETHHNGDDGSDPLLTTKAYSYDAYGHRIALTDAPAGGGAATYTYGYDVHGSVSLLLNSTGTATASYGYRPYGGADAELTRGDLNADNPLNAFRYSAKRLDSGSGSIDMGARRFGPDTSRFLQRDAYNGAVSDLGLALDPLTQNRYALASGNPISFVEVDGHRPMVNGGGGGGTTPNPEPVNYWQYFLDQLNPVNASASDIAAPAATGAQVLLDERGQQIITEGAERAAGYRGLAQGAHWWDSLRYQTRAAGTEAWASVRGGAVRVLGGALGIAAAGLTATDAYSDQLTEDANRPDLSSTERTVRAGISSIATTGVSFLFGLGGALGCGALSGGLAAAACAAGGSYVGSAAGATVGEYIINEAGGAVEGVANWWDSLWD